MVSIFTYCPCQTPAADPSSTSPAPQNDVCLLINSYLVPHSSSDVYVFLCKTTTSILVGSSTIASIQLLIKSFFSLSIGSRYTQCSVYVLFLFYPITFLYGNKNNFRIVLNQRPVMIYIILVRTEDASQKNLQPLNFCFNYPLFFLFQMFRLYVTSRYVNIKYVYNIIFYYINKIINFYKGSYYKKGTLLYSVVLIILINLSFIPLSR